MMKNYALHTGDRETQAIFQIFVTVKNNDKALYVRDMLIRKRNRPYFVFKFL